MTGQRIVVIGAGAAGLMAVGKAAEAGVHTLLLEKMKRPARKLCIAGKGRCNITNIADLPDFIAHFGKTGSFLRQAGGIDTGEIDPRTMESRLTKGLFIAGKLLDIQADTGGYNLQAAFSTGWLAGVSAAQGV